MQASDNGLAIVAGRGELPRLLAEKVSRQAEPWCIVQFEGVLLDWTSGMHVIPARFEKPGRLFSDLRKAGISRVTFAGGMKRPRLDPLRFDLKMLRLAPRVLAGMRAGDSTTLDIVAQIFEAERMKILGAHEVLPNLLVRPGILTKHSPAPGDRKDAARAEAIVTAMGRADVGQASVVAQGVCLGIESIQGTDAMLEFVARTGSKFRADPNGGRGVIFKGAKPGQDRRMDLPTIGPDTVRLASAAGLAGIVLEAENVMMLHREQVISEANDAGLFIWGRSAGE